MKEGLGHTCAINLTPPVSLPKPRLKRTLIVKIVLLPSFHMEDRPCNWDRTNSECTELPGLPPLLR